MPDRNRRRWLQTTSAMAAAGMPFAWTSAIAADPSPAPEARDAVISRPIGSSGERLPVIGLGTWQTFDISAEPGERQPLRDVLRVFHEWGGRVIDSSPMYGRSESVAGDLMAEAKLVPQLFVATKVWTSGKDAGQRQMRESMQKLRVRQCDLMQVHNLLDVDTHLDTLAEWKLTGRIRYTGITHYTADGAAAVARILERRPVDFVQINYSVAERDAEQRLLPLCRERGIAVLANRPFAGGEIIRRLSTLPVPGWAAACDCTSWAQLLLKFVVSHPAITCAIPASRRAAHVRDNMAAGQGVLPDPRMREKIAAEIGKL